MSHYFTPGPTPKTFRAADGKVLTVQEGWIPLSDRATPVGTVLSLARVSNNLGDGTLAFRAQNTGPELWPNLLGEMLHGTGLSHDGR